MSDYNDVDHYYGGGCANKRFILDINSDIPITQSYKYIYNMYFVHRNDKKHTITSSAKLTIVY